MTSHPSHEHPLQLRDSIDLYREFDGRWKCDNCNQEYTSMNRPYHCSTCSFDICESCYETKQHVRHEHPLYCMKMINVYPHYNGEWKCDGCGQNKTPQQEPNAYHCFIDQFDLCRNCVNGHQTSVHVHPLVPADAAIIYDNMPDLWICDICRRSGNQLRTRYSWHCSVCEFDCCNYCLQEVSIPDHPHPLKITDSFIFYPNYGGRWRCDICRREQNPTSQQINSSKPYHCNQCEFDACHDCVNRALLRSSGQQWMGEGPVPMPMPFDITGPSHEVLGQRVPSLQDSTADRHAPPVEPYDFDDDNINVENLDDSQKCIVCLSRPKNATIVHQRTGHVCCCLRCAYTLQQRGDKCPICRAEIDTVIKHYNS